MAKQAKDDLEAVRAVIDALDGFEPKDQERIIRWAQEKIGLATRAPEGSVTPSVQVASPPPAAPGRQGSNIKAFVSEKNPGSDNQFAAVVAYYYQFEAPENEKKEAISSEDLQDACRKAGRQRLSKPGRTLSNAHNVGLLDKAADRGMYRINSVGENLVAMTLPGGTTAAAIGRRPYKKVTKKKPSKKKVNRKTQPRKR